MSMKMMSSLPQKSAEHEHHPCLLHEHGVTIGLFLQGPLVVNNVPSYAIRPRWGPKVDYSGRAHWRRFGGCMLSPLASQTARGKGGL